MTEQKPKHIRIESNKRVTLMSLVVPDNDRFMYYQLKLLRALTTVAMKEHQTLRFVDVEKDISSL